MDDFIVRGGISVNHSSMYKAPERTVTALHIIFKLKLVLYGFDRFSLGLIVTTPVIQGDLAQKWQGDPTLAALG